MSESEIVLPTPDQIIDEVSAAPRINDGVLSFGEDRGNYNTNVTFVDDKTVRKRRGSVTEQLAADDTRGTIGPADNQDTKVEYEIQMPGGGTETYDTTAPGGNIPVEDTLLKAKRHLAQMRMLTRIMKKLKRRKKLKEARGNKVAKSRKKRDQQKVSRKKNR